MNIKMLERMIKVDGVEFFVNKDGAPCTFVNLVHKLTGVHLGSFEISDQPHIQIGSKGVYKMIDASFVLSRLSDTEIYNLYHRVFDRRIRIKSMSDLTRLFIPAQFMSREAANSYLSKILEYGFIEESIRNGVDIYEVQYVYKQVKTAKRVHTFYLVSTPSLVSEYINLKGIGQFKDGKVVIEL